MYLPITICILAFSNVNANSQTLDQTLASMRSQSRGNPEDLARLEREMLDLLAARKSPDERGKILVSLVRLFSETGYSGLAGAQKTEKYCEDALKHPVDRPTTIFLHSALTDSIMVQMAEEKLRPDELGAKRQEASRHCFEALRMVLSDLNVDGEKPLPRVSIYECGTPDSARCKAYRAAYEEEVKRRRSVQAQNQLVRYKKQLASRCVELHTTQPADSDEFESSLEKFVRDPSLRHEMRTEVARRRGLRSGAGLKAAPSNPQKPVKTKQMRPKPE